MEEKIALLVSETLSLVPGGEILTVVDVYIAGKYIRYYFAYSIPCHWSLSITSANRVECARK